MDIAEPSGPDQTGSEELSHGGTHRTPLPRPELRTLLKVGIVGGVTTGGAYALSRGSIPVFVGILVAFGILTRVGARVLMARLGRKPPRGWWL
jgi:hypothetical protein